MSVHTTIGSGSGLYIHLFCCSSSDFMFGLYQMFVGDARPHERDTWLFHVIESMNDVIIPAVRMALKLHEVGVSSHLVVNLH